MKISKMFALLLVLVLVLVGCTPEKKDDDDIPANTDQEDLALEAIHDWIKAWIPEDVNEDLTLPATHPELGGIITWTSFTPDVIDSEGKIVLSEGVQEVLMGYSIVVEGASFNVDEVCEFRVIAATFDQVAQKFADQFVAIITRDYNVNTNIMPGFEITWTSSNPEVFTNDGEYIQPIVDTPITLHYEVTFKGETKKYTKEVTVQSASIKEKMNEVSQWIRDNYLPTREITSEINLPTYYEKYDATISWRSGDLGVIGLDGSVNQFSFDRYVSLESTIKMSGMTQIIDYSVMVAKKEFATKEDKINSFLEAIAVPELDRLTFAAYSNINQSFNFIPFYTNENAPIVEQIIPVNSDTFKGSRPGTRLASLEYITIHDTANPNANGQAHANLLSRGYPAASWHFAIDDIAAYQSIPTNEKAWHAGDGSLVFNLTNTGVVATTRYPVITIDGKGFYALNGQTTAIKAPTVPGRMATTADIAPAGIYTEVRNGTYYMGATYYNTGFGKISNTGGNSNSVGIETSVHNGSDYATTLRITAKVVAEILVEHNLSVDRVLQHNNFSGKDCPNAIRHINYWNNFLDLVSMERFAKEELGDVNFVWTSSSSILRDNGRIELVIGNTTSVDYSVTATFGTTSITRAFTTRLVD